MKNLLTLAFMLIVSITAFAQQISAPKLPTEQAVNHKQDTVFNVVLSKSAVQLLFNTIESFGPLVRRSPDLSALQADEAIKNVAALGTEVYKQIKSQLPPQPQPAEVKKAEPKH